jgi:hypothetical protein
MVHDFVVIYEGSQTEEEVIARWVRQQSEWMADALAGARTMRSLHSLTQTRRQYDETRALLHEIHAEGLVDAYLEAVAGCCSSPLQIKLGIYDQPKQAARTDDVWDRIIPNGEIRPRGRIEPWRMFMVVSKLIGGPIVLPGLTDIVETNKRPDFAVKRVLERIAKLVHTGFPVELIGFEEFDHFDLALQHYDIETTDRPPFTFRVPQLMREAALSIPAAFKLPPTPAARDIMAGGVALRRLRTLRATSDWQDLGVVDVNGTWLRLRASTDLRITAGGQANAFTARIVRTEDVTPDAHRSEPEGAQSSQLLAVLNSEDDEHAARLAAAVLSTRDDTAAVLTFIEQRKLGRVLRGEFTERRALAADRALASVALARVQLDNYRVAAS